MRNPRTPMRTPRTARVSASSNRAARRRSPPLTTSSAPRVLPFSSGVWRHLGHSLGWSKRESQIVPALFADEKESAIATRLGISRHTVHTYTGRLYRKMGVTSRVGLVQRIFLEYMSLAKGA